MSLIDRHLSAFGFSVFRVPEAATILIEGGYTGKTPKEIKHDFLIKDFVNFEKIVKKYL